MGKKSQFEGWTEQRAQELQQAGKIQGFKSTKKPAPDPPAQGDKKKRAKFGAVRNVDEEGRKFDSIKERKRYKQLKLLLKAGKIAFLARQVEFELNATGSHSVVYKADFTYQDQETGERITEDCKGHRTREYKKKKKLMKQIYDIDILET